jgi:hypothetical protein
MQSSLRRKHVNRVFGLLSFKGGRKMSLVEWIIIIAIFVILVLGLPIAMGPNQLELTHLVVIFLLALAAAFGGTYIIKLIRRFLR